MGPPPPCKEENEAGEGRRKKTFSFGQKEKKSLSEKEEEISWVADAMSTIYF